MRQLPASDYIGAKAAFRQLLKATGGGNEAARVTRVAQQVLSSYGSLDAQHAERFAPIDVVADLEAECGQPIVTRKLAELSNCLLVPLPRSGSADELDRQTLRTAQEYAELIARVMAAGRDGKITAEEAPPILTDIHELMVELAGMAEAVQARVIKDAE
jgi:hypothetical protein